MMRRHIIKKCKTLIKDKTVTLITTQMVECGVDLDFDRAFIDWQGFASTIQRGGRVGREGRSKPCLVDVFRLVTDGEISSYEVIKGIKDLRSQLTVFEQENKQLGKYHRLEQKLFRKWKDELLTDFDLTTRLAEIQSQINLEADFSQFFQDFGGKTEHWSLNFRNAEYIAELYESDYGEEFILFKDVEEKKVFEDLIQFSDSEQNGQENGHMIGRFINDRRISISHGLSDRLGFSEIGICQKLQNLRWAVVEPAIF